MRSDSTSKISTLKTGHLLYQNHGESNTHLGCVRLESTNPTSWKSQPRGIWGTKKLAVQNQTNTEKKTVC